MEKMTPFKRSLCEAFTDEQLIQIIGAGGKTPAKKSDGHSADGKTPAKKSDGHSEENKTGASPAWLGSVRAVDPKEAKTVIEECDNNIGTRVSVADSIRRKRYLSALSKMRADLPFVFTANEPYKLYESLSGFCAENDIPDEIAAEFTIVLIEYAENGRFRPILLVGPPGCGKTTAARLILGYCGIPAETVKVPSLETSTGLLGDNASYVGADCGALAAAMYKHKTPIPAFIFDEIDKCAHPTNRASADQQLLSVCDESSCALFENYLGAELRSLCHCPIIFTANSLESVNKILADRCCVVRFPDASLSRVRSVTDKYVAGIKKSSLYRSVEVDPGLIAPFLGTLYENNVRSLRKYQQFTESFMRSALLESFRNKGMKVSVTKEMLDSAAEKIEGAVPKKMGFAS